MSAFDSSTEAKRGLQQTPSAVMRDAAVAVVTFGLTLGMLARGSGATRALDAAGVGLAVAACLPLIVHRRWPLGVFALCAAASAAIEGIGYAPSPPIGPAVALFYLAADEHSPERLSQITAATLALGLIHSGATALAHTGFPTASVLGAIIVWGVAWIVGDQLRQRRQRLVELNERAGQVARDAARERQLAVAEERNRIARDLHDSVAHAINVILVQAGGARLMYERDPAAVSTALSTIEAVSRETIEEMDQLIRGLRGAEVVDPTVDPPAGLASLATLLERHRAAGIDVHVRFTGSPRPIAPGPDQAAYRIVQESLTNAARHGTGPIAVRIAYGDRQLELTITNTTIDDREGDLGTQGYGIVGMRERAALLGGSLDAKLRGGSFEVTASLPYSPAAVRS